jgi:hypothetical protein
MKAIKYAPPLLTPKTHACPRNLSHIQASHARAKHSPAILPLCPPTLNGHGMQRLALHLLPSALPRSLAALLLAGVPARCIHKSHPSLDVTPGSKTRKESCFAHGAIAFSIPHTQNTPPAPSPYPKPRTRLLLPPHTPYPEHTSCSLPSSIPSRTRPRSSTARSSAAPSASTAAALCSSSPT